MSIKDLFGKRSNKIVTKQQADKLVDEVESQEYVSEVNKGKQKFIPKADYSDPKNFAKYGSAEKYYEDTVEHIYSSYPYDGSEAEKSKWDRESSPLDAYILEKEYPKAVGHVLLNTTAAASNLIVEASAGTFTKYLQPQYIYIQGGPNRDKRVAEGDKYELSKQFPAKGGKANIWDEDLYRASNLGINPAIGNSVELWYKLEDDAIIAAGKSFCLFDLWNGQAHAHASYVRVMVEVLPGSGNDFSVTYKYGSGSEGVQRAALNITAATKSKLGSNYLENWNHYSFTMKSSAAGITVSLYVNGVLESTVTSGNEITSEVPQENYVAIINAYNTKPISTSPEGITKGVGGAPKLYIDDFRFWKTERTGRDIGRNWFTSVSGGTNTDDSKYSSVDNVDIGVYYKFNEGILDATEINVQDAVVLDYSGRISNGQIENYTTAVRKLTSAIDECVLLSEKESPEPIVYSQHPLVVTLLSTLKAKGNTYDNKNNASFYHTMPEWILQEDEDHAFKIKELSQALSSYFDTLHLQIGALTDLRDNDYQTLVGNADKPYYFAKNLLRSVGFDVSDIFTEATILEELASRGETELFDLKIQEIKNVIYQNIYNNITHIYKTKGTEKSFRNLIRCFGVDDELIKINLYADGVDYTLEGRRGFTSVKKNYADFNNVDRHESTVYLDDTSGTSTDERAYLLGPTVAQSALLGTTLTAEVIFPKQLEREHPAFNLKKFTEVSLFGTKEANVVGTTLQNYAQTAANIGSFRVTAIKPDSESLNVKFKLTYTDSDGNHELVTEEYKEVYDNTKWNIAVRLRPLDVELGDHVAGAAVGEYKIEFYGVQATLDTIENEFSLSASYTGANVSKAQAMIQSDKLCYVGALRTDLADEATGTASSDVKVTDLMYWFDYLTDEEIKIHAIDASNVGRLYPNDEAYSFFSEFSDGTTSDIKVPRKDTLALHWNFQNVSSSDSSGNFTVNDVSLGDTNYIAEARYGWFTNLVGYRHQGKGSFKAALPNDKQVVNREYQYTARHRLPEVLSGDDMIEIRTQDDDVFVKGSKPINHFFAIEKSMSQVISTEMLSLFASIVEFNDLIGQPINRYRMQYKSLEKFRSLFYERVENTPSFEKYVEFYKWIDSSLGLMLQQLIPASGNFSGSMRNMVESHILERSKYWTKFPTLEKKQDPPEGTIRGIRELTYDWEHGHAPVERYNKKAILFDGANDHVLIGDADVFSFTDGGGNDAAFSISAWVYIDDVSSDNGPFVAKALVNAGDGLEYIFKHANGQLRAFLYKGTSTTNRITLQTNSAVLTDQTWHHVVLTYSGNKLSSGIALYVDGVQVTSTNTSLNNGTYTGMTNQTTPLILGKTHNDPPSAGQAFEDKMADICIFNKQLSSAEVKEAYNDGRVYDLAQHSAYSDIISWWKMGDDQDATGSNGIKDYVSTNHGTLTSGASIVDEFTLPSVAASDNYDDCLWRSERAERGSEHATSSDTDVDNDRESLRKAKVRDIVGQTKMVLVSGSYVEQGSPTLYDIAAPKQYEGSTYATRRLSRPYKLNLEHTPSISGGPNFADATLASPNDMLRAATHYGTKINLTRLVDDPSVCRDNYEIDDGPHKEKRRPHVVTLTDAASVQTEIKGSLFAPPFYGAHPLDASATQRNVTHDSYGTDHEIPIQGPFTEQWVGGNQHRHIDLNTGSDAIANRPELYLDDSGQLVHPHLVDADYPAARYTRDGLAKRSVNIKNINSTTANPRLGNYNKDYEVVQTSGRSNNNRWLVKNPDATPNSVASTYVTGLYDYTLPVRENNSAGVSFGRTEHVFVERFSAPGSPATMSRGSLDYQAEEFSPYNSMNFRNLRVRNHLNFWQKEHSKQFGYREDYIHGTPSDAIGGISNDFGGNTANVASWHKNNRNAAIRMKLDGTSVYAERSYDNFFIGHQIPRSSWQYNWISASAVQPDYAGLVVIDDEHRSVASATAFPWNHDSDGSTAALITHPRYKGYITDYPNATIDLSGRHGFLRSASYASHDIDFSYGNTVVAEAINYDTQTIGSSCGSCVTNLVDVTEVTGDNYLHALLLNRNGPYQGAGWKFLRNEQNPIVRRQRGRNEISIQNSIASANPMGHQKFVEPPAAWNRPFVHVISEESDVVGTRITHSYSNNLEGFANPKLTKRTGFVKRNEQFYDRIFDNYNPSTTSPQGKLYDFVGLYYKEYVFPKHRNVGLLKVRNRVRWDRISSIEIAETPTGDLRMFWKDEQNLRRKSFNSRLSAPTNALGYKRRSRTSAPYLNLDSEFTEHLDYDRSIFSMDTFEVVGDTNHTKVLGDLQYTGKENYFSFVLSTENVDQEVVTFNIGSEIVDVTALSSRIYLAPGLEESPSDPTLPAPMSGPIRVGYSIDWQLERQLYEDTYGALKKEGVFNDRLSGSNNPEKGATDVPTFWTFVKGQHLPPEPVAQLYYNPFNKTYQEDAWLYRTNVLANKNPWYDSYADFNLETRAMAQNYGLVAEFKISEHMDKYLLEDSGEFKSKNYNIFSLEGASYNGTESDETRYSGKTRYTFENKYFINKKKEVSTDYPTHPRKSTRLTRKVTEDTISRSLLKNNAFTDEIVGASAYTTYDGKNPIYIGGTQTIKNSVPVTLGATDGITPTFKESAAVSYAATSVDDGTGRHQYYATGRPLPGLASTYENVVYRSAGNEETLWTPVHPHSHGPFASLKFNLTPDSDDFMEGSINKAIGNDVGLSFLRRMTQTAGDTPEYQTASPFTFSVWAKPNNDCPDADKESLKAKYDGQIKGLITFGTYSRSPAPLGMHKEHGVEQLTVYSNFPMPTSFAANAALTEKYKDGMGVTIYVPGLSDTKRASSEVNYINLFHFFDADGNPAVLPIDDWSQVIVQVMPAISSSPIKIKLYIRNRGDNPPTVMYGIHRGLLEDATRRNRVYTCVPVVAGASAWGAERHGYLGSNSSPLTTIYKLGKSRFVNKDESATIQGVLPIDDINGASQYYFSGELMEFSLWQGLLSSKDINKLSGIVPTNILEDFVNREIIGGYTSDTLATSEWGATAPNSTITGIGLGDGQTAISYSQSAIGLTSNATRSKVALLAWHRLGVLPVPTVKTKCDDWDDGFFDSYIHTDPIRFYDNVVEDHDAISKTTRKRIRLKVNALKKLVPYRGFYPQDRTLQLAKLFADKMKNSISTPNTLHEEQGIQAALQPFFAPGILYNSIKAGIAVDWPAFTNQTGLEPSHILEKITLPYEEEENREAYLTSVAPNWYVKRQDEYNALAAIAIGYKPEDEESALGTAIGASYTSLQQQQPKYFASEEGDYSKRGYVILSEPSTRIPFEGLVSLDSVLPSKTNSEAEILLTNVGDKAFKHFDMEISGWDAEGVEILLTQPEPISGYGSPEDYPDSKNIDMSKIKMVTKAIKIGDSQLLNPEGDPSDSTFDVNVDFRRSPKGFNLPGYETEKEVSLERLNKELAIKICRAINKRPDIHFVAVPGYLSGWEQSNTFDFENRKTDDHLAFLMPVCHPEVFGIEFNEPEDDAPSYDRIVKYNLMGDRAFLNSDSPTRPFIGDQGNGTWRIRIVYVGLPRLELDLNLVDIKKTTETEDFSILSPKPFERPDLLGDGVTLKDISEWSEQSWAKAGESYAPIPSNWKETHLQSPFEYEGEDIYSGGVNTCWNVATNQDYMSAIPYSFFEGGSWLIDQDANATLADAVAVSALKNIIVDSKWVPGYGWFGYPKFSIDNKLGIRYVDANSITVKENILINNQRLIPFGDGDSQIVNFDEDSEFELLSQDKPKQGPFRLYGGVSLTEQSTIAVVQEPHKIYLMAPEYYVENSLDTPIGGVSKVAQSYKHPYFEYLGSNGDMRFEMAMHNFLAEVPNFFLRQGKLTSFVSKKEKDFKTMESGKTYYMDVTMHKSDNFNTAISPWSNSEGTMEGRYYGPAFSWQSSDDYERAGDEDRLDRALVGDPAQAPYVPPYLYGKAVARLHFECFETRKYSLEEIMAGVKVDNLSQEQISKFVAAGASLKGALMSPAWNARTTISSSMNLFGKATAKNIEFSAQFDKLKDVVNDEMQKFVPQIAKDPEGSDSDVWAIGTKFECPILNFYDTTKNYFSMVSPSVLQDGAVNNTKSGTSPISLKTTTPRGTGIWAGYGVVPKTEEGVFVTIEDTFKQTDSFGVPKSPTVGSLLDVCGFTPEKKKVGDLAEQKEISEAVIMIPFVDSPSETTAQTVLVDGRNFFKINKEMFNLQKANIENGKDAVSAGEYLGVTQNIPETSVSNMIRGMKKYNLPPRYDFIRYPLKKSESPFVMYVFEFHHLLNKQDLANIWQGLPPSLAETAIHDSVNLVHDLSPVDFFEENTLPKNVRWMVFKAKKRANDNYFATTSVASDDSRFKFDFEFGKKPPKYNYNWPYDFFTMLEAVQVEAGLDIIENKMGTVPQVVSNQGEISSANMSGQLESVKKGKE